MKRSEVLVFFALLAAIPATATASPIISAQFCPGAASCPTGVTATLVISDWTATPLDINDYLVDVTFSGTASAPYYLDLFSFTIDGVATPNGYEARPILTFTSADASSNTWSVFYDNVSNSSAACTSDGGAQEVCTNSSNPNQGQPLRGKTLEFQYYVDLAGTFQIVPTTGVNLRAAFNNNDANFSNAGILSPNGLYTPFGGGGNNGQAPVPEPASLLLLGTGLVAAARARRKTRA